MNTRPTLFATALTTAVSAVLISTPAAAQEPDRTPQHIGTGAGFVAGAVIGGPVGAIIGTTLGSLLGHQEVQTQNLQDKQQQLLALNEQLLHTSRELALAETQLQRRRDQLSVTEQQLNQLSDQHYALKDLVGELKLPLFFNHNSDEVAQHYQPLLQSLSRTAARVDGLTIDLDGYSNRSGTADYNQTLSERRSQQVQQTLTQFGMPPLQVQSEGKGSTEVTSTNPYTPLDRRVDLQFSFEPQSPALLGAR